ncbi:xanthine dehydrogenase small subunit [Candidatus Amoebophilus asiaticus]|nr:xanthine dehydrogenase small subunit [Candidatus Amoebophilus asiaticus]
MKTISFVLDDEIVEIDFNDSKNLKPTTTVLNYLRSLPTYKGSKEGCAEGDCGACTVVIGELDKNNKIKYKSYDSCLVFLPMIHGKQLITVEHLGSSENLHPVQDAMVETDGSQCGYCTPGFIMSLFELYKNSNNPTRAEIDDALTGNLCRCTGYKPIVEAAAKACVHKGKDQFTKKEPAIARLLKQINKAQASAGNHVPKSTEKCISIVHNKQKYFRPFTLHEALKLKDRYRKAILVCGATDIGLRVTKNKELLEEIIDLTGVKELNQITEEKDKFNIGAGVNLEEIKALSKDHFPAMYDMLAVFGSRQIRYLATLGGNLGSASPIGDTPPVLMAYDATIVLESVKARREIKAKDFITGYHKTKLKSNEIITQIKIPRISNKTIVRSYKISKRKDLDISTVSGVFRLQLDVSNTVKEISLFYGGVAAMIISAKKTEEFLKGKTWERSIVEKAMKFIDDEFTPISDARSGAEARKIMARNLLLKFWTETR